MSARAEKPATATAPMARLELTSPAQKARLDEKLALAQRIIDRVSDDAQRKGATPEWREGLAASLYRLSNEALQAIEPGITTLDDAHAAAALAAGQAKALGDANNDLVFTPITPCRFVDTRNVGGPVSTLRVFDTANAGSTYGGAAGCALSGIGEPAIALNLTATGMTAPGYLIVRPQGSVNTTSFINWDAGAVQIANAGIVTTQLASNGHYEFEITGNKGAPQVIVDYFGYFSAPAGTITGNGGAGDGVAGITSGAFNSGVYGKNTGGGKGVFGVSATGVAVAGQSTSGTGAAGNSSTGSGVYGQTAGTSGQSGAAGVWGDSHDFYGVWGTSVSGDGVHGNTSSAAGNTSGVAGIGSGANAGVTGLSSTGNGVQGLSSGAAASGVYGHNTTGYGVYGRSDSGYAMGTDGPAFQATNQGGWIKAMVVVAPAGFGSGTHIVRCFNSRLTAAQASTPPCGMLESEPSTGYVSVDFGFDVSQRFASVTALGACSTANNTFCTGGLGGGVAVAIGACAGCFVNSQVGVNMERPDNSSYVDVPFTLIVY
ncbi:MAG: hypothetical protein ABI846_05450 [Rudaea sp.]